LHIKTGKIWIATVYYQRIAKNFNFSLISQIVTGQNANKSKFKASGQAQGKQGYKIRQSYLQNSFKTLSNHS
jgi:hypothetical protein